MKNTKHSHCITWKIQNIHTVSREIYKTFTLYHMKITKHSPCITWKNTKHSHCITWKIQNIHTVSSEKKQTVNNGHELKVPALCFQPKEYVKYADLIMELRLCLHKSSAGGNIPVTFEVLYISAKGLRQWEVNFNRNNHVKAPATDCYWHPFFRGFLLMLQAKVSTVRWCLIFTIPTIVGHCGT